MSEKQVVNLSDAHRNVVVKAKISKKKERPLYWFFEKVGDENVPLKFLPKANWAGFQANSAQKVMTMTNAEGKGEVTFRLSVAGKDKFKVMVGLERDGSDKTDQKEFEVWRRIWCSLSAMPPLGFSNTGPVDAEYNKHGIEIIWVAGKTIKYERILETGRAGLDLAPPPTHPKLEARLIFVDRIWISKYVEEPGFRANAVGSKTYKDVVDIWPEGDFISGSVTGHEIGGSRDIEPYVQRNGPTLTWDFTTITTVKDITKVGRPLPYTLKYKIKLREAIWDGCAHPRDGRILIARHGNSDRAIQQVIIHELGHGLGLVPALIPEYNDGNGNPILPPDDNPTYYGPTHHCNTGAHGTPPNYRGGTCTMFHLSNANNQTFCGSCAPIVRRTDLDRDNPARQWPAN